MFLFSDPSFSGPGVSINELMSWFKCVWLGRVRKCVVLEVPLGKGLGDAVLIRAYTVWFSSDFEPNSDSCDCFLSRAEFQLCRASFVVQCSFSVQGETRSDKSLPTGNRTVGWISDMSEILVAPREGIAQLKQSYEPTALNSVLFPSLRLRGNSTLTISSLLQQERKRQEGDFW